MSGVRVADCQTGSASDGDVTVGNCFESRTGCSALNARPACMGVMEGSAGSLSERTRSACATLARVLAPNDPPFQMRGPLKATIPMGTIAMMATAMAALRTSRTVTPSHDRRTRAGSCATYGA